MFGGNVPRIKEKLNEKTKKLIESLEIIQNLAEEIIDEVCTVQEELIKNKENTNQNTPNTYQKVSSMCEYVRNQERTQKTKRENGTGLQVQKMYVPIFRLSYAN
jgi:hypothetical protein